MPYLLTGVKSIDRTNKPYGKIGEGEVTVLTKLMKVK
jgi:hypothetical protein